MLTGLILFVVVHLFCAWLGGKIANWMGFPHWLGVTLGLLLNLVGLAIAVVIGLVVSIERDGGR